MDSCRVFRPKSEGCRPWPSLIDYQRPCCIFLFHIIISLIGQKLSRIFLAVSLNFMMSMENFGICPAYLMLYLSL